VRDEGFRGRYPYTHEGMENQAELDSWIRRLMTYRFQLRTAHFPTVPPLHSTVPSIVGGRGVIPCVSRGLILFLSLPRRSGFKSAGKLARGKRGGRSLDKERGVVHGR